MTAPLSRAEAERLGRLCFRFFVALDRLVAASRGIDSPKAERTAYGNAWACMEKAYKLIAARRAKGKR